MEMKVLMWVGMMAHKMVIHLVYLMVRCLVQTTDDSMDLMMVDSLVNLTGYY